VYARIPYSRAETSGGGGRSTVSHVAAAGNVAGVSQVVQSVGVTMANWLN
jgi:hypothetical protein